MRLILINIASSNPTLFLPTPIPAHPHSNHVGDAPADGNPTNGNPASGNRAKSIPAKRATPRRRLSRLDRAGNRLRPTMEVVPLSELALESVARVAQLQVYADDATRLKAMGICVGRQVQLVQAGDPLILRVLGARVGLSARLAAGVGVVPIDS